MDNAIIVRFRLTVPCHTLVYNISFFTNSYFFHSHSIVLLGKFINKLTHIRVKPQLY